MIVEFSTEAREKALEIVAETSSVVISTIRSIEVNAVEVVLIRMTIKVLLDYMPRYGCIKKHLDLRNLAPYSDLVKDSIFKGGNWF